jgi:hypothetical protein
MMGDDFEEVRFESSKVFVSISRCPSRLEWDVEIGLLARAPDQEKGFGVSDLAMVENPTGNGPRLTAMWPDTLLTKALAERAEILKGHGGSALVGDASFFERLSAARAKRLRDHWATLRADEATRRAAIAFRRKNWIEVVDLLGPIRSKLSVAQRKKLEYAQKQSHLR